MTRTLIASALLCALCTAACNDNDDANDTQDIRDERHTQLVSERGAAEVASDPSAAAVEDIEEEEESIKPFVKADEGRVGGGTKFGDAYGFGAFGTRGRGGGAVAKSNAPRGGGGYGRGAGGFGKSAGTLSPRGAVPQPAVKRPPTDDTKLGVNGYVDPRQDRVSTFAADVDTGSYTYARAMLKRGHQPAAGSVRVEEFVNYFDYDYRAPNRTDRPFAVDFEATTSPFDESETLLRIGVQGRKIDDDKRKPAHLTFLVDVSGSMSASNKLPLAKEALRKLVGKLDARDTVALATYAGGTRKVLEPTSAAKKETILAAIDDLRPGGSTNMSGGLDLAYKMAYRAMKPGHVNRVIVLSDGDANVNGRRHPEIFEKIKHFTKEGVTLSTIGFGMGNYRDANMERLADKGNGNYYYIDSEREARRVFVDKLTGTIEVIAKDVKIQVEFDPRTVAGYRLIGYENRDVADKDFRNDAVDAGEIGAGHQVTAIYAVRLKTDADPDELATVRIRHKKPDGARATEHAFGFSRAHLGREMSRDFKTALAAAALAEKLRGSEWAIEWSWATIAQLAKQGEGRGANRAELVELVRRGRSQLERTSPVTTAAN